MPIHPYSPGTLPRHSGHWFVYIRRDGRARMGLLAGPFDTAQAADQHVDTCRQLAYTCDPWSHFDHFGVCELSANEAAGHVGVFNAEIAGGFHG